MTTFSISTNISCFRSSAFLSAVAQTASAICNCLLHLPLFLCHILSKHRTLWCCCSSRNRFFQLGSFLFPNFNLLFNLHSVFSGFLSNFQLLLGCNVLMTLIILVLVIGPASFFETLFSSCVSACSWHCSFGSFDSLLLLGTLF